MKVDAQHPYYAKMLSTWQKCDDAIDGQTAIHEGGARYLPKLSGQTDEEYKAYKLRASFFNAAGRTYSGLVGMIFRKPPVVEMPASFEAIANDIDLAGTTLTGFANAIANEVLAIGRIGVLVEFPSVEILPNNQAEASAMNLRPYVTTYDAETIINWRKGRVNNAVQPTMVTLVEDYIKADDGFETEYGTQYRVLSIENGTYLQRVYRKSEKGTFIQEGEDIIPFANGKPLNFIPFYVFGAEENGFEDNCPPLLSLIDLNIAHYRVTADYEHGCHFAGLPTPIVAGFELPENTKFSIGSPVLLSSSSPDAKWGFLEFTGQGLGALEANLERKEKQMAAIGARMLEQQKSGVESEGAMQMRSNGENSVLANIVNLISWQLSKVLTFMAEWAGINQEVKITLNTDYYPVGMTAQELAELVKAWQSNAISYDTLFNNLKRGEVIAENVTLDDEQEKISTAQVNLSED